MSLNKNELINRKDIFVGEVVKNADYYKGGLIANLMCDSKEIEQLPYFDYGKITIKKTPILRGMIFILDTNNKTVDVVNCTDSHNYPIANVTEDLKKEIKQYNGVSVRDFYNANGLLEYLGFGEQLTLKDVVNFKQIISKEKELVKLASICGYRKINTFFTWGIDYEQQTKLGRSYYKFTGSKISEDDRCIYKEKDIFANPIKDFKIFELLASNLKYGYEMSNDEKKLKLSNN